MPAKKAQKPKKPKTYLAPTADKVIRQPSDGVIERANHRVEATYNGFIPASHWK